VRDPVLAQFPAPQNLAVLEFSVEVHEPLLEALELAADLLQLDEAGVDLAGDVVDLGLEAELLR